MSVLFDRLTLDHRAEKSAGAMTLRNLLPVLSFFTAIFASAAHAEFSEEWQAHAEEIKAACAEFEASLPARSGETPTPSGELKHPLMPRGEAKRPHMCIFLRFSVDGAGETGNVKTVFKGPSNLNHRFSLKARNAAKKWRFTVPKTHPEGFSEMYARIDYQPAAGWRYQYRFRIWAVESENNGADD